MFIEERKLPYRFGDLSFINIFFFTEKNFFLVLGSIEMSLFFVYKFLWRAEISFEKKKKQIRGGTSVLSS